MNVPFIETQASISHWAEFTFGELPHDVRLAGRANSELAELVREVTGMNRAAEVAEECADVAIILCRFGTRHGFTVDLTGYLQAGVRETMESMTDHKVLVPALVEMAWLMDSVHAEPINADKVAGNVSQLMFILAVLCWKQGTKLETAIQRKMMVNRKRQWKAEAGTGYHVRESA